MHPQIEQLVGRTLGQRYRLERILGVGGMGAVFEATQLELGRSVAVKVLLDVDERGIARLKQEALTAGSLSCPHVVSIFDFQAPPGEPPFIVMEILPGHSLAKLLQHEPVLSVPRAARIASQMLIGLEAAHRAGVLHRDVKPSNTWLVFGPGVDEHVKMLDFGIAKMLGDGQSPLTTTGAVVGTPAYLAPEQLRGMPLDARVDIHAMGVVLFEMLTGARPWKSTTASVYAEILEYRPPPLHTLMLDVPSALSAIVERALAKDPAARFPRAADMRVALEAFAAPNASSPTYLGGLGAETGGWRPARGTSTPPSTLGGSSYGQAPSWPQRTPSTVSMLTPTVDGAPRFYGGHAVVPGGYPAPGADVSSPPLAAPAVPPRARSFALPIVLGGGFVGLAAVALVVVFALDQRGSLVNPIAILAGSTVELGDVTPDRTERRLRDGGWQVRRNSMETGNGGVTTGFTCSKGKLGAGVNIYDFANEGDARAYELQVRALKGPILDSRDAGFARDGKRMIMVFSFPASNDPAAKPAMRALFDDIVR